MGRSRTPGCHLRQSTSVTAESGRPEASSWLRRMWVCEIPVAQREPLRACSVGGKFLADGKCLVRAPPALVFADAAAQRVHDRVQIRADPEAEQGDVIARVADDGDLSLRCGGLEPAEEACGPDAARRHCDAHTESVAGPPRPPALREAERHCGRGAALREGSGAAGGGKRLREGRRSGAAGGMRRPWRREDEAGRTQRRECDKADSRGQCDSRHQRRWIF